MKYDRLFEPFEIEGKLTLPNRLVMAPMTTTAGEEDGSFSDGEIAYLSERARLGIGLVMTPACYCHKSGHSFERQVGCHSDAMLPALGRCAEAINRHGAASFLQIHHGGNAARERFTGERPWAPSAIYNRRKTPELPFEMSEDQIFEIAGAFAESARRAKIAGFSGIELHGANTYLFQQFFSPYTNQRTDRWGCQSWDNRCRFAVEVTRAVRAAVGPEYAIAYRISPEEEDPRGIPALDTIELLKRLVATGIDIIHVSSWSYGEGVRQDWPEGSHPTKLIKDAFSIPVIGVGMIRHPDQAMRVLADGVDLVAMGRELLYEPEWAAKVSSGASDALSTRITSKEEIQTLRVPERMKAYIERFWPDRV